MGNGNGNGRNSLNRNAKGPPSKYVSGHREQALQKGVLASSLSGLQQAPARKSHQLQEE